MQATVNPIAERISSISVSSTMKVSAEAERLRSEGVDVVDFGAGDAGGGTPTIGVEAMPAAAAAPSPEPALGVR